MPVGRHHLIVVSEIVLYCFGFGRRFDDNEVFLHYLFAFGVRAAKVDKIF